MGQASVCAAAPMRSRLRWRHLPLLRLRCLPSRPTDLKTAAAALVMPAIREAQTAGAKSLRQIAAALNGRGIDTAGREVGGPDGCERPQTVAA
jgi:hypothetical protein